MSRIYNNNTSSASNRSSSSSASHASVNKVTIVNSTPPTAIPTQAQLHPIKPANNSNNNASTNSSSINSNSSTGSGSGGGNNTTKLYINNLKSVAATTQPAATATAAAAALPSSSSSSSPSSTQATATFTKASLPPSSSSSSSSSNYSHRDEKKSTNTTTSEPTSAAVTAATAATASASAALTALSKLNIDKENSKMAEDLTRLITRLETVTNRLESYAQTNTQKAAPPLVNGNSHHSVKTAAADSTVNDTLPASLAGYDDILNGLFGTFKELSAKIGPDVKTIVDLVEKVFKMERSFLIEAARCVQPTQDVLTKFFQLFSKSLEEIQSFREKNRQSPLFNHLSAISESIGALGWIAISPAPAPYIKEMSDSAQFYTNRVLKDYKEKDANHSNWVKQWLQLLNELQTYVKQNHTTGVSWNSTKQSKSFDLSRVSSSSDTSAASSSRPTPASAGGPPPPPPPPPMPSFNDLFAENSKAGSGQAGGAGALTHEALFAEINKGSDITKGLKKVSDAEKTHKNPNLRAGATVPGEPSKAATFTSLNSKSQNLTNKPPVFELQDKKWLVEYQTNRHDLVISETDLKQSIYIYKCNECTVTVKGKVNAIILDSCSRVGLLFDDVLGTVEFINSSMVQMQVLGRVPTVSIDKTDGCQVYLSRDSVNVEIVTSKSSSMNILVPNEGDDDFTEHPVPEQFKTVLNAKTRKLVTTPTESA